MSKTAFLFPGQGAQAIGMGQQAYDTLAAVRKLFERAEQVLNYDLAQICFQGPVEQLNSTVYSQPALFVAGLAALEVLRSRSPETIDTCQAAAGLSLGEYTAIVFAGAMDFEWGLRVVQRRGAAMQAASDATPSGMLSLLGLDREQVQRLCDDARGPNETLEIANYLCPGNIVISGHKAACERAAQRATEAGAMKAVPLAVAGAFHTPIMEPAVEQLAEALQEVQLSRPRIPVVSNVDARPHEDPEEIRKLLVRQVMAPVQWEDSMRYLLDQQFDMFYELGPGRILRGLMKRIHRKAPCEGVNV